MTAKHHSVSTIGRGAFWSVFNQVIGQGLSLAVFLVTARYVSPEDFGIMATCMIAVEIFRQFLIETMGGTIYSRKNADDHDYTAGFVIIAVSGIFSAALVYFLASPIELIFGHDNIAPTLHWVSLILLVAGLSKMHEIWLVKHLQFKTLAIRSIITVSIGGGVGIYMALNGYGLASLIAQQLVISVTNLLFLWTATPWRPSLDIHWDRVRSILHYWKFLAMTSLASMSNTQGDVFFSSYYLGPALTGFYNAGKRLTSAVSMVMGGLNGVAFPALTSMSYEKGIFQRAFVTTISLSTALMAPLYLGLAILSHDVIAVVMGDKWMEVAPVLSILMFSTLMGSVNQYSSYILLIEQKAHWQTILGYVGAALNILLLIIFARYGLIPMALALLAKNIIFLPINAYLALRLLDMKWAPYLRAVFVPVAFALIMAAFVAFGREFSDFSSIVNLLIFVPVGGLIYLALYIIFDRTTFLQAYGMLMETIRKKKENNIEGAGQ